MAIVLRIEALHLWRDEVQQKWMNQRVIAVLFGVVRVVSAYQPIWDKKRTTLRAIGGT